jgi:hypothetical protein
VIATGASISLLASLCFNANNLLEKRAVDNMPPISFRRPGAMLRTLASSRLWMLGFLIGVVAIGLLVLSYSLTPTIVVQSIFGGGVVLLVLASHWYLGERLARRERTGIAIVIIALVCVSITLGTSSTMSGPKSALAVSVVSIVTAVLAGIAFWKLRRGLTDASVIFGVTSGLLYGVASFQTKAASTLLELHGDVGGVPWLLRSPYPYAFFIASLLGLICFQTGLQRCRLSVLSPLTTTVASVYVVVASSTIFGADLPSNTALALLRFVGYGLVLLGTWFLATPAIGIALAQHGRPNVPPGTE